MNRYAFLLGNSSVFPKLNGVENDLKSMQRYLMSTRGGAWKADEICVRLNENPKNIKKVRDFIKIKQEPKFVYFYWSGHGALDAERRTYFNITEDDDDNMYLSDFRMGRKELMVIDTCREKPQPQAFLMDGLTKFAAEQLRASVDDYQAYRDMYDAIIKRCKDDIQIAYSCSMEEQSQMEIDGLSSLFTSEILQAANNWNPRANGCYYSLKKLLENGDFHDLQHPRYVCTSKTREPRYFPFVIHQKTFDHRR